MKNHFIPPETIYRATLIVPGKPKVGWLLFSTGKRLARASIFPTLSKGLKVTYGVTSKDSFKKIITIESESKLIPEGTLVLPKEEAQWLTGFWEGDGSISLTGGSLIVCFTQKEPEILNYIGELLSIKEPRLGRVGLKRRAYQLVIGQETGSYPLLNLLLNNIVSEERYERIKKIGTFKGSLVPTSFESHKVSLPWLAGFFDAEGSIYARGISLFLSIPQKDIRVLKRIKEDYPEASDISTYKNRVYKGKQHYISNIRLQGDLLRYILPEFLPLLKHPQKRKTLVNSLFVLSKITPTWDFKGLDKALGLEKITN